MDELTTIRGGFLEGYKQLVPKTFQTSAELVGAIGASFGEDSFYTANIGLYGISNGKAQISVGEREEFTRILGKSIETVCERLMTSQDYRLSPEKNEWVKELHASGTLEKFYLEGDLSLKGAGGDRFMVIDTNNYAKRLTAKERSLAEIVYGKGNAFAQSMKCLSDVGGILQTNIWVLHPSYICKTLSEGEILARMTVRDTFLRHSDFYADVWDTAGQGDNLSGMVRKPMHPKSVQ